MILNFSSSRARGFSLLEMLVAVSIIGLLATLLVPKASEMMKRGQSTKCMNSLRQISTAMYAFAADNGGKFPAAASAQSGSENTTGNWFVEIMPYFGGKSGGVGLSNDQVYAMINCPTFISKYKGKPGFNNGWVGYGMNLRMNLSLNDTGSTSSRQMPPAAIPNHSKTILIGEGTGLNLDLAAKGYKFLQSGGLEGWPNGGTPDRHESHSNYLFVDGHVASLKKEDAEALLKPRLE